jgi:hypothetical protein
MKKFCFIILLFWSFNLFAQNELSLGSAVFINTGWGANVTGDFKVAPIGSKAHLAAGAYLFGYQFTSHELPHDGEKFIEFYAAPQASVHYHFTDNFDCFLRGGPGWLFSNGRKSRFLLNAELGASLSFSKHVGARIELGLPFSSLGLTFRL